MNGGPHLGSLPHNKSYPWLYTCLCNTRPCQCLARLKPNILVITQPPGEIHIKLKPTIHWIHILSRSQPHPRQPTEKTKTPTPSGCNRRCRIVCNTHYPHIKHLRCIYTKQHHQPLQTMLHLFKAYTRMHAINPPYSYQIPHTTHA